MDCSKHEDFVRKPRNRTMPLVVKPFEKCLKADAKSWNVFIPDLDVLKYKETLSKAQETKLHNRAANLAWRAVGAQFYHASEFYWEVCAWHDIFGLIHNDEKLRADKRPYRFVETDSTGKPSVITRIPDATFGIKSFDKDCNDHGYPAYRRDIWKEPEPLLWKSRLLYMMRNPACGLVVDGMWGDAGLIFPFAAYEAKSGRLSWVDTSEQQIQHACRTYLAMLDDLARDPNNVAKYQTKESSQFQLFAFTSFGSAWAVYVAWSSLEECMVEMIWHGDIRKYADALQLIYLVDQIHDFAVKQHYPFVLKHLEAWYARDNQNPEPPRRGNSVDKVKQPLWLTLEKESKMIKKEKARETRKRNRDRRPSDPTEREAKRRHVYLEEKQLNEAAKEAENGVTTIRPRAISISSDSD